jgi:hypothetical protein
MTEKDKKEIKGYMKKLSDDFGKQIGVYIENVNDRFKVTNEKLGAIDKKLDSHTSMLAEIAEEKTLIKIQVSDHENRISTLETSTA